MRKKVKIEDPHAAAERAVQIFLLCLFLLFILKVLFAAHNRMSGFGVTTIETIENNALHE
jgi:hypothetical protein